MKNHHGGTLCISTQAGCRMGCAFCASTQLGLARNLTIGELCGQLYAVRSQEGADSFTHVVLMGCGSLWIITSMWFPFCALFRMKGAWGFRCAMFRFPPAASCRK
ncbi:MAG: hypothetical protein ACLUO4_03795 [Christensenellales bacterium]